MRRLPWISLIAVAAASSLAPRALADETPAAAPSAPAPRETSKKAVAQELFDQGLKLIEEGKLAEACPKLAASNKAEWAPGTTFQLADCYERTGRLASAWALYLECEPHFRNRNPPDQRADLAEQRADSLYPKLSRLLISVPPEANEPGLVVRRDGEVVDGSQWGTGLPVDPGKHVVEASAPGKRTWRWEAEVGAGGATVSVPVPPLESGLTTAPGGGSGLPLQKKIAIGAGAAGVVGAALGGLFGGLTLGAVSQADQSCTKVGDVFQCDATGADLRRSASTYSTVSTVGLVAGGLLVAGGVVLWFTAPSTAPPKPSKETTAKRGVWVAPVVGAGSAGLSAGVRF